MCTRMSGGLLRERYYHVYKDVWGAAEGEVLPCTRGVSNIEDPFAVAAKSSTTVGHVPGSSASFEEGRTSSGLKYLYKAIAEQLVDQRSKVG